MKFVQILLSLSALFLLGTTATPVGKPDVSPTDRPINLPLESIPDGAPVFGLDGGPSPTETDAGPFRRMTKRDDCNGSWNCQVRGIDLPCNVASNAYDDNAWYCGYTSRVAGHCTAIFTCGNYHGSCWAGWFLKQK